MTLRLVQISNSLPFSWPVDPNATFQAGQVAQLYTYGNEVVCGVSDGTAPIGIIDDMRTNAFTAPSVNETVLVRVADLATMVNNQLVLSADVTTLLQHAHVTAKSFMTDLDVLLVPENGGVVIPAGTPLNYDFGGTGSPDSIRFTVSYTYQIPNVMGDDSTFASGRVTVWFQRIIFETDQFETNQAYPLGCNLFVNESGLFTSRQPSVNHSAVALCTAPPNSIHRTIQAVWL